MGKTAIIIVLNIILLSALTNCNNSSKQKIISGENLNSILVDMHLAEGMHSVNTVVKKHELDKETLYAMILDKHGYTKSEFDSAMSYYSKKRTKMLLKIYDDVMEELSRMDDEANNEEGKSR